MTTKSLSLQLDSGDAFDVRRFSVEEALSSLFSVRLVAFSPSPSVDFDRIVGQPAGFVLHRGVESRYWTGVCKDIQLAAAEEAGLSTYELTLVPTLWLLTQRRNYRMFQQISEVDAALSLLAEWGIEPLLRLTSSYKTRKYRVQYAESDFAFFSRILEDVGVTYHFEEGDGQSRLVLSDAPQARPLRTPGLPFRDDVSQVAGEYVTAVRVGQRVRPAKYTLRDHDYRKPPEYRLIASAEDAGPAVDPRLERYHYTPGAFLFGADKGQDTPSADDRGKTRTDEREALLLAEKRLQAKRGSVRTCHFEASALDLAPGVVMQMLDHPRADLAPDRHFLITSSVQEGSSTTAWTHRLEARPAEAAFRPALVTPKPKIAGVESATVVGPPGEEIHTDEFGRVRVHFHWDRESLMDEKSSCWIHVSQPWGGAGYGSVSIPRIGQEVLVDFLGGDPDRPIITGRVYTNLQKVPFKLPHNKTQTGLKSASTGGGAGYNELMFEDSGGQELFRMQAEKDLKKLVKNDESATIGRNLSKLVKGNESAVVGKNFTKNVAENHHETTGANHSLVVGENHSSMVGSAASMVVGESYVLTVTPPVAAAAPAAAASPTTATIKDKLITFTTGAGASITLEGSTIRLEAKNIHIEAGGELSAVTFGEGLLAGLKGLRVASGMGKVTVAGKGVAIGSSGGDVTIDGGAMVKINGAGGMPAGRLGDPTGGPILNGATTVLIGGPTLPFPVKVLRNGDIQVGEAIIIKGTDAFKATALARLCTMSNTKSGLEVLNTVNDSGKTMTIVETAEANSYCGATDYAAATIDGNLAYNGAGSPVNNFLGYQKTGTGEGSNTILQLNPDFTIPNPGQPGNPIPNDAIMFHEMNHGAHQMTGTYDGAPLAGWTTREEEQTILTGTPSEGDYLAEIGYPDHRTDHDRTFAPNP